MNIVLKYLEKKDLWFGSVDGKNRVTSNCDQAAKFILSELQNLEEVAYFLNTFQGFSFHWDQIPVFGGDVPTWDGVCFDEYSYTNNSVDGYAGTFDFAIISWSDQFLLVADVEDFERPLFVVSRSEFFDKKGVNL